jgi:hypothetical protein
MAAPGVPRAKYKITGRKTRQYKTKDGLPQKAAATQARQDKENLETPRLRLHGVLGGGAGAIEEELAFAGVARQRGGAFEIGLSFGEAAEFEEKVAAHTRQEMVGLKRRIGRNSFNQFETCRGAEGHRDSYGAIEFNHRRRREFAELLVERGDARPVGGFRVERASVACGDRSL